MLFVVVLIRFLEILKRQILRRLLSYLAGPLLGLGGDCRKEHYRCNWDDYSAKHIHLRVSGAVQHLFRRAIRGSHPWRGGLSVANMELLVFVLITIVNSF